MGREKSRGGEGRGEGGSEVEGEMEGPVKSVKLWARR